MGFMFSKPSQPPPPKRCSFSDVSTRARSFSVSSVRFQDDEKCFEYRESFDLLDRWSPAQVFRWLEECKSSHRFCRETVTTPISGFRLIDCNTLQIVEAPADALFVALSYVWGRCCVGPETEGPLSRLPDELPLLMQDVIRVVKALGIPYLWVDQYCVDQSNPLTKHDQMQQMDLIYRKAELTIDAAAGIDQSYGLPGVSTRRRMTLPPRLETRKMGRVRSWSSSGNFAGISSLWHGSLQTTSTLEDVQAAILDSEYSRRAWTYQESKLSRRCLVFTKEQMYFECAEGMCRCETDPDGHLGGAESAGIFSTLLPDPDTTLDREYLRVLLSWDEYSKRHMTVMGDVLNAFAGMIRWYQSLSLSFCHLAGVYFLLDVDNGSWRGERSALAWDSMNAHLRGTSLAYALGWAHKHSAWEAPWQRPRRRDGFPSWSPAGWVGETSFSWWKTVKPNNFDVFADNIAVEVADGGPAEPYADLFRRLSQQERNTLVPRALVLDSVAVPAKLVSKHFTSYRMLEWTVGELPASLSLSDGTDEPREFLDMLRRGECELVVLGGDDDTSLPSREYSLLLVLERRNGHWVRSGSMRVECTLRELLELLGENNVDIRRKRSFRMV